LINSVRCNRYFSEGFWLIRIFLVCLGWLAAMGGAQAGTLTFSGGDGDLGYNNFSVTRTVDGQTFTISGGDGKLGFDNSGLYTFSNVDGSSPYTITAPVGYMFDLTSFWYSTGTGGATLLTISGTSSGGSTSTLYSTPLSASGVTATMNTPAATQLKSITITGDVYMVINSLVFANIQLIPAAPTATTGGTSSVTASGATLAGTVNDNSATTTVSFQYGTTASYGSTISATPSSISAGSGATAVSASVSGLNCNITYHYRVQATNSLGTTNGSDATFTTSACVPGAPTIGTATAGDTQASVSFTAPASNGGAAITSFAVISNPGGITASGSASPITVTGLSNGASYTFTVTATNSAGTGSASAASNSVTPKASQTITFNNPGAQNLGTVPTLTATSTSGLTVTFSSSTSGVCTITSGGALTFVTTGTCTINADQAGNSTYLAALTVTRSFTVNAVVPGAPTIGTATAGDTQASVAFSAPASNGGSAITGYTVTANPGGATGTGASSPITVTGLSNGTSYTFTVTATNSAGTGSASAASNSVTPKASQTITFNNPGAQNFGATPTLSSTASSGLSVSFTSSTTGVCTITTGGALTFVTAGTCTINADQAGSSTYLAATTVTRSFTVNAVVPGAPTIGTATAGDTQASVAFSAPASNGGSAITGYTVTANPGGATGTGASSPITVTGLSNGTSYTFTVTATNSAGTGSASGASNSVTPNSSQTITFANPGTQNFGTPPTLTATSTSGLTVTFSSSTTAVCTITSGGALTFVTAGTCTINADQAGNGSYSAATTVSRSFTVAAVVPGAPTIGTATAGDTQAGVSFTAPASNGGAAITSYTVTSSPGGITASGSASPLMVTGLSNGTSYTFTVTATNSAGTGTASAASNSVTPKASQTITFNNPGAQNFGVTPTLSATASSGLSVSFTSSTTGVCTITTGGALTFVTVGTCTINADQAGNATYQTATTVARSFTVNAVVPGAPTIGTATAGDTQASVSFTAPMSNGGVSITSYTVTSNPGGLTGSGTSSPLTVTGLTNGTSYIFTVTATNSAGTGSASGASNSVTPNSSQTITFANPGTQNFGTPPTLTATSTSGLTVTFSSSTTAVCTITSGGALTFVTAGTCTINADQAGNGSYSAATTVSRSFTVAAVVPGAPTIGTATAGDVQASVSFSAPASNGGSAITGYTVTANPGGVTGTGTFSPITVTGLSNGTSYTFTVTATNSAGTGFASAASNNVTPKASQTITFNNPGAQNFGVTPTLSATASSGLSVSFTSSTTGVCTITTGGALTFVTAGTCSISADQAGNVSYLAAATVTQSFSVGAVVPGAPAIGTATAGNNQAAVSFTAPASNGGAAITSYTVTSNPGGITASGSASPITVTGLSNGTAYTFTVRASNSAGTGAASAASNSATPIISVPVAASLTVTVAYASGAATITPTITGGTPTSLAIAAAPAHGTASVSGLSLLYTPASGFSGADSFSYTASNASGTSAVATVTVTVSSQPPVVGAVSLVVEVNSSNNVVPLALSGGVATTVAVISAPAHGTAVVSGTALTYTPASGYAGADSFTYAATNTGGTSAAATVSITVRAWPDPSKDAEVIALVKAQVDASKQFAQAQINNYERRMERLHVRETDQVAGLAQRLRRGNGVPAPIEDDASNETSGADTGNSGGITRDGQARHGASGQGVARTVATEKTDSADNVFKINQFVGEQARQTGALALPWASMNLASTTENAGGTGITLWTAGSVHAGRSGAMDSRFVTRGLTIGADARVNGRLTIGGGVGVGHLRQKLSDYGTRNRGENYSFALYGSYQPVPGWYADGLVGYGRLDYRSQRYVTADGSIATASRRGSQWFGSLTAGYEFIRAKSLLSPYVRLEHFHTRLAEATESGSDAYDLIYSAQGIESSRVAAGLRAETSARLGNVTIRPNVRLEYQRDFDRPGTAPLRYVSQPDQQVYGLDIDANSSQGLSLAFGSGFDFRHGWGMDLRMQFTRGSDRLMSRGLSAVVKRAF